MRSSTGRGYLASRSFRLRLQFAGALILLMLPLFAAALAFGTYASKNARLRTDTRLSASLRAAGSEYARIVDDAQLLATELAAKRQVQNALRTRDRTVLARLQKRYPTAHFLSGDRRGAPAPGVVERSTDVLVGDRVVGSVVVEVGLDDAALARIARRAGLEQDEVAVAERGGRVVASSSPVSGSLAGVDTTPDSVVLGDTGYRAVAAPVAPGSRLGILAPSHTIDAAARSIRGRIMLIGFLVLTAVMLMAYALAPALARQRVAQQQRAIAERVLAHVADGVLLLDPEGIVRFWNSAAEAITGLPDSRVLDHPAAQTIPGWNAVAHQIPVGEADQRDAGSATVPLEAETGELWVAASGVRFADGIVYTFRDITEDERLDQAKTDFVATVSHELRTPLASVYGAALTLQRRFPLLDEERRDQLLGLLADQANRLSTIIDELLLASKLAARLDSGRLNLENERFDADAVARAVVQAARIHAPVGIEIELTAPPWLPDATGDGDKLGQVLANLVENAVKYSPQGGRIDVRLDRDDERIRFEVKDEGLGHPARRAGADLQEVLPPRSEPHARNRRHGPRPVHLSRARASDGRRDPRRVDPRRRLDVLVRAADLRRRRTNRRARRLGLTTPYSLRLRSWL